MLYRKDECQRQPKEKDVKLIGKTRCFVEEPSQTCGYVHRCFRKLASILDLYGQYWQEKWVSKVTMPQPIFRCFRRFEAQEYICPQRGQTCSRGLTMGKRGASGKRGTLGVTPALDEGGGRKERENGEEDVARDS
ncbi:hypothetical protein KM043_007673 [Ampulex compressa]|nr:hypothetical protein KM043_007673 [Ampulex compressa]